MRSKCEDGWNLPNIAAACQVPFYLLSQEQQHREYHILPYTGIRLKGRPSRPNACDEQEQRDHVLQLLLRRLQPRWQRRRLLETSS